MSIRNETNDYYSYCVKYRPDWEGIVVSIYTHIKYFSFSLANHVNEWWIGLAKPRAGVTEKTN